MIGCVARIGHKDVVSRVDHRGHRKVDAEGGPVGDYYLLGRVILEAIFTLQFPGNGLTQVYIAFPGRIPCVTGLKSVIGCLFNVGRGVEVGLSLHHVGDLDAVLLHLLGQFDHD